jgi:hypothetical protein
MVGRGLHVLDPQRAIEAVPEGRDELVPPPKVMNAGIAWNY